MSGELFVYGMAALFASVTVVTKILEIRAWQRRKRLKAAEQTLRAALPVRGEILSVQPVQPHLDADVQYTVGFPGTDGLPRKALLHTVLNMSNLPQRGMPAALRVLPAPIPADALRTDAQGGSGLLPALRTDRSGLLMLESDHAALLDAVTAEKKRCRRAVVKYGIMSLLAGIDFYALLAFLLYLLYS